MSILYGNESETKGITLIGLIEDMAIKNPEKKAIGFGDKVVTYKEMIDITTNLAGYLQKAGVVRESLVGIYMDRSEKMIISIMAVIKAGGAYVPLDPTHPADRNRYIIEKSGITTVLTESKYAESFGETEKKVCIDSLWSDISSSSYSCSDALLGDNQLAYVIFTSGSTGNPKGVEVEHEGMVNYLLSVSDRLGLDDTVRGLSVVTITFDISISEMFLPLINGGMLIVADKDTAKDGVLLASFIKEKAINLCGFTPSTAYMLLETGAADFTGMKMLIGGEPWSINLAYSLMDNGCEQLWNVYGPTETTIYSTMTRITKEDSYVSIGLPIDQTDIYVLDSEMKPVAENDEGRLYIGGVGVARGYYNNPELTNERFIKNPIDEQRGRIYDTGDIVKYLGADRIVYVGRSDFQVKVHGFRIELGEIESALEKCEGVEQAVAVVAGEDQNAYICAFMKTEGGKDLSLEYIKDMCEKILPYYMIPSRFIFTEKYPMTANLKVDRKELLKQAKESATAEDEFIAPRNEIEEEIADIWASLLDNDHISVTDDFFELGGHSLLANRMVIRINKAFGTTITLVEIFSRKITIEEMAQLVEENLISNLSEEELAALLGEE